MVTAEGISPIVTPGVLGVSIMTLFALFVGLGPTEHDGLLAAGLVIAAVVLAILAFRQLRTETSKARTRVVGVFALIGIASIAWAGSEPVFRLINLQRTNDTIASI